MDLQVNRGIHKNTYEFENQFTKRKGDDLIEITTRLFQMQLQHVSLT